MVGKLHKLTAGDGYVYLIRQVAVVDSTGLGRSGLAAYYSEKGESPGRWWGAGLDGVDGVSVGQQVTEEQMRALFGEGRHPDADAIQAKLISEGMSAKDALKATQLGRVYMQPESKPSEFFREATKAYVAWNLAQGLRRNSPIPDDVRAQIRTEIGTRMFVDEFGRAPLGEEELSAHVARLQRPSHKVCAGYDFTFTPVKSVSALWAVAPRNVAERIEAAHQAAVHDALTWVQSQALYTRRGAGGVRIVETRGLMATQFQHRDSRGGDPNLHTHVAVANKVQAAEDGKWLAIDGVTIYKAFVSASERYDTALEKHLSEQLGLRFAERTKSADAIVIREVVGVPQELCDVWSSRRADIESRKAELVERFRAAHGRLPSPIEGMALAQQATLETRQAKHEPRSLAEQRRVWRDQAGRVLGSQTDVDSMVDGVLTSRESRTGELSDEQVRGLADRLIGTLEGSRSRFQPGHVEALAQRLIRAAEVAPDRVDASVARLVTAALDPSRAVRLDRRDPVEEPAVLRRSDGTSMYDRPFTNTWSTAKIMQAERRLVTAAQVQGRHRTSPEQVQLAAAASAANGVRLNPSQRQLVEELATSGRLLQLALAPAGSGKTTAMAALADAWRHSGGTVVGLSPTAVAAAELGQAIKAEADTMASLTYRLEHGFQVPQWATKIDAGTLVLIDEAGMSGTLDLDSTIRYITERGGSVRLIGDDQQLSSISAGGVLVDIRNQVGACSLAELVRFRDPQEAAATLAIREGDTTALGFYFDRGRVHATDESDHLPTVFEAWRTDTEAGKQSLMLASSRDAVTELNDMARTHRLAGTIVPARKQVRLASGLHASAGDLIITRKNDRRLRTGLTDYVRNGDRWRATKTHRDGSLTVKHDRTGKTIKLPSDYVAEHADLGYACTVHGAQGTTVDTCHVALAGMESRQLLYVALSRGRHNNHVYLNPAGSVDDPLTAPHVVAPESAYDLLETILKQDGAAQSATTFQRESNAHDKLLHRRSRIYTDALGAAAVHEVGQTRITKITEAAEKLLPGLTDEPAWDTLLAHLAIIELDGDDSIKRLDAAIASRPLDDARDQAAVLDWRLDSTGQHSAGTGPLPWLTGVPTSLTKHPVWGPYLTARSTQVREHATQLANWYRTTPEDKLPDWALPLAAHRPLLADVAIWRAWANVDDNDPSILGPRPPQTVARKHYYKLSERTNHALGHPVGINEKWGKLIDTPNQHLLKDPFWQIIQHRLDLAETAGINAKELLTDALNQHGVLPIEQPAGALWYRLVDDLAPIANHTTPGQTRLRPNWIDDLLQALPETHRNQILLSPMWPTLVATIEKTAHTHHIDTRAIATTLGATITPQTPESDTPTLLVLRTEQLLNPPPEPDNHITETDITNEDYDNPTKPTPDTTRPTPDTTRNEQPTTHGLAPTGLDVAEEPPHLDEEPLPGDIDVQTWLTQTAGQRHDDYQQQPEGTSRDRIIELHQMAAQFYRDHYTGSSAATYITSRFGEDLTNHDDITIGYAPPGWTNLTDHLRAAGATNTELLDAGLAKHTKQNDRIIDIFRDRVMLGIHDLNGDLIGFIGRAAPGDTTSPKYMNTPTTTAFQKSTILYGYPHHQQALKNGAIPVRCEGAFDAIAITLAGQGRIIGIAPLGTALTQQQADLLTTSTPTGTVWIATDTDTPGQTAATKDFWTLANAGANTYKPLLLDYNNPANPPKDPAELYSRDHGTSLTRSLDADNPTPIQPSHAQYLINQLIDNDPRIPTDGNARYHALQMAANIIAAAHPTQWATLTTTTAQDFGNDQWAQHTVAQAVTTATTHWNTPNTNRRQQAQNRVAQQVASLMSRSRQLRADAGRLLAEEPQHPKLGPARSQPTSDPHASGPDVERDKGIER